LANADVADHYRFHLTTPTGTAVRALRATNGSWQFFLPAQDDPVFIFAAPHVTDRQSDPNADPEPEKNATLTVVKDGADYAIDLAIDATWLRNTSRVFPVELDPTISIQPDSQDAYFHGNVPTDVGFH